MSGPFRTTHKLVLSGTEYGCQFIQKNGNLWHVSMVDPEAPIKDGSEFTIMPDKEENVYVVVAGTIITRNRPPTSVPWYQEFDATKKSEETEKSNAAANERSMQVKGLEGGIVGGSHITQEPTVPNRLIR